MSAAEWKPGPPTEPGLWWVETFVCDVWLLRWTAAGVKHWVWPEIQAAGESQIQGCGLHAPVEPPS